MRSATRLWVPPKAHDIWRRPLGCGKCWLDLQASEAKLILCNGDEKMKRGMAAPTPHVTAPRQQRPRCSGARQRRLLCVATATPQSRRSGAQRRRPLCATLQHPRVGSRFSLKQPPGLPCGDMASAQGFLSTRSLEPTTVARGKLTVDSSLPRTESLGAAADRTPPPGAGPNASTKVEPANDRPSPRSVLIQMSTQLVVSNHRAGFRQQTAGRATPIQSQRICSHAI